MEQATTGLDELQRRAVLVLASEGCVERMRRQVSESIERLAGGSVVGVDLLSEQIVEGATRNSIAESTHSTWLLAHLDSHPPADPYAPHAPRLTLLHNKPMQKDNHLLHHVSRSLLRSSKAGKSIRRKRRAVGTA